MIKTIDMISANTQAHNGRVIAQIIQVHHCIGKQYLVVLVCLRRKFNAEFRRPWCPFKESSVVDVDYPSYFQFQVIEDVILYGGTVTAPKTGTKNVFQSLFNGKDRLVIFNGWVYVHKLTETIRCFRSNTDCKAWSPLLILSKDDDICKLNKVVCCKKSKIRKPGCNISTKRLRVW